MVLSFFSLASYCVIGSVLAQSEPATLPSKQIVVLKDREINESSGIVRSLRNEDCFWTHNDSGDKPRLFLVHRDGRTIARFQVQGVKAIDWEDIAITQIGGVPKLIIGDIGGNAQPRKNVALHIISEPLFEYDDSKPLQPIDLSSKVETTIRVTFKTGVSNCEAIAVDHASGQVLIVEKALLGGRVYVVPLPRAGEIAKEFTDEQAKEIGHTEIPFACACDISDDNKLLVVTTYTQGYLFTRKVSEAGVAEEWSETLKRTPFTFRLSKLKQAEAVCFSKDARSIYMTSEQLPTPIIETNLP